MRGIGVNLGGINPLGTPLAVGSRTGEYRGEGEDRSLVDESGMGYLALGLDLGWIARGVARDFCHGDPNSG